MVRINCTNKNIFINILNHGNPSLTSQICFWVLFFVCVHYKPSFRNTQSMLFVLRSDTDEGKLKESKEHCKMIQKLTCLMER